MQEPIPLLSSLSAVKLSARQCDAPGCREPSNHQCTGIDARTELPRTVYLCVRHMVETFRAGLAVPTCESCGKRPADKTDGQGSFKCNICAAATTQAKTAMTVMRGGARAGRNDPCPCGSRRKLKKCCQAPQPTTGHRPLTALPKFVLDDISALPKPSVEDVLNSPAEALVDAVCDETGLVGEDRETYKRTILGDPSAARPAGVLTPG